MGSQTPPTLIFEVSVCFPRINLLDCRNLNRIWFLCLGKHNLISGGREIKIAIYQIYFVFRPIYLQIHHTDSRPCGILLPRLKNLPQQLPADLLTFLRQIESGYIYNTIGPDYLKRPMYTGSANKLV